MAEGQVVAWRWRFDKWEADDWRLTDNPNAVKPMEGFTYESLVLSADYEALRKRCEAVEAGQALANVPFGWVKDTPSGVRSTLDFTVLPGIAEGWRADGYRVVTLYSLPYLNRQPFASDVEVD